MASDSWNSYLILDENRSAVEAARRVAESLTNTSNRTHLPHPLLLHGPPGVGKSALIQALIRDVIHSDLAKTVQHLPASEFPRTSESSEFDLVDLYNCDLLAIEDLHHFKPADANAFRLMLDRRAARRLHTVISTTDGPANLDHLPRRLTNRLAAGLVVRIDAPGVVSRLILAKHFSEQRKLKLTPEALAWLAETQPSPRPLIGTIEQLRTISKKWPQPLDLPTVQLALAQAGAPEVPIQHLKRILAKVGELYHVKPKDLIGPSRLRTVLIPRQVAMYLANKVACRSLVEIGKHFGGRDHSTVLHAVRKIESAMSSDAKLAATVRELAGGL